MFASLSAGGKAVFGSALVALLAFAGMHSAAAGEAAWPTEVTARYNLLFNGFDVGKYQFQSRANGKNYSVTANASVSALFGAFTWKGNIAASGTADAVQPHPAAYKIDFKSKSKVGQVSLGFDQAGVKTVAVVPAKPPSPEAVPLKPEHMKNVFDPMAAILAVSHAATGNPCNRKIPIFDGKVRFDLVMSYKGEQKLTEKNPSGQPANLTICSVKYVPLAGHKPKDFVNPWVDYNAIEISLRPVPSAGLYVPYRVTIPTSIGAAVMQADRVDITAADRAQIALTR